MQEQNLSRRQALKRFLFGAGVVCAPLWVQELSRQALAQGHHQKPSRLQGDEDENWRPRFLNPHHNATLIVLTEMIIPQTDTGGAKEALVNRFIDNTLAESDDHPRHQFVQGLNWMDRRSGELFGSTFVRATPEQQTALLTIISSTNNKALEDQIGVEFFQAVKALTITGYYTSEIGILDELEGGEMFFDGYDGCTHPEHMGE